MGRTHQKEEITHGQGDEPNGNKNMEKGEIELEMKMI